MKYITLNLSITHEATNPRCKKKKPNTTDATQGHIRANVPGFFSFPCTKSLK